MSHGEGYLERNPARAKRSDDRRRGESLLPSRFDRARTHFRPSATHTVCGWKGTASYYDVVVGDAVNPDAAWYYPSTKSEAKDIEGYVAFWHGVRVDA